MPPAAGALTTARLVTLPEAARRGTAMKRQSSSVSATVIVASVDRRKRNLVNPEEAVPRLITVADSVNDAPAAGFASLAMGAATVRSAPDDAGPGDPGPAG